MDDKPAKYVSEPFRFQRDKYPANLPVVEDVEIAGEALERVYDEVPEGVWERVEYCWTRGLGDTHDQLRAMLKHMFGLDVPESVLKIRFHRERDRLVRQRLSYLERLRADDADDGAPLDPNLERFKRMFLQLGIVQEGIMQEVLAGDREITISEFKEMVHTGRMMADGDPSVSRKREGRGLRRVAARVVDTKKRDLLVESVEQAREMEAEGLLEGYEAQTAEILEDQEEQT